MTESEAIKICNTIGFATSFSNPKGVPLNTTKEELTEAMRMSIQALEKQIPKKPILKHDVSVMHINRGEQPHEWKRLESDNWHCPECDSLVGERVYVHDRHHDQRKKKYCDNCGQKLNWESDEE